MRDIDKQFEFSLFCENRQNFPYYIVSPPYTRFSAGIRVLHILCSALNQLGQRAYMLIHPTLRIERAISSYLSTPWLTYAQIESDFANGRTPITIYPEVIGGNIFGAPIAFEYLLNFRGALGQGFRGDGMEGIAYSEAIRRSAPGISRTLFIPTSDPRVFFPQHNKSPRHGIYYYAAKYQILMGMPPALPEPGAIEIKRDGIGAQSLEELLSIYRRAERLYIYENSAVATEAALCGCPVVCMPSTFFTQSITRFELGDQGIAWGNDQQEVARAEKSVSGFYEAYLASYRLTYFQLSTFISETQALAQTVPYTKMIDVPALRFRNGCSLAADLASRVYYRLTRAG